MSTSAEIGRKPMARRRDCSHAGLGPFLTLRNRRPATKGQASALSPGRSRRQRKGLSKVPGTAGTSNGLSLPRPAAARSRAMPRTPRQSPRFGVISTSITGSSRPKTSAKGVPTTASSGRSMMPSCSSERPISRSETSMPLEASPRITPGFKIVSVPGM